MNPIALIEVQAVTRRKLDGAVGGHPARPEAVRPSGTGRLGRLSAWLKRPLGASPPTASARRSLGTTARGRA